jgi:hypothetical protein
MNEKEKLKYECSILFKCYTINDCFEIIDIYSEFIFQTILKHHQEPVFSLADSDAKIVLQMMLTKVLHLKNTLKGISYKGKNGKFLNKVIDPTVVASQIRNIYETVAMFNLIYRNTKSEDEKTILYNLWVHSGLKYRQRFESVVITREGKEKVEHEKKQIVEIVKTIEGTELYKQLTERNKEKIKHKLKEKDYLIKFENNDVHYLHWHELSKIIGDKNGFLSHIYSYFSLYSHPSNVSVFKFKDMFNKENTTYLNLTIFNVKNAFMLFSSFIADYIKLFPSTEETFNELKHKEQIVINFFNVFLRGQEYSINNCFDVLE